MRQQQLPALVRGVLPAKYQAVLTQLEVIEPTGVGLDVNASCDGLGQAAGEVLAAVSRVAAAADVNQADVLRPGDVYDCEPVQNPAWMLRITVPPISLTFSSTFAGSSGFL